MGTTMGTTTVRSWLAASAGLLFAAGASLGFLAATRLQSGVETAPSYADSPPQESQIIQVTNERVYELLGLGKEERAQADRILGAHFERHKRLRQEREALNRKLEADLEELLDDGQRGLLREIIRTMDLHKAMEVVSLRVAPYKRELRLDPSQEEKFYSAFLDDRLRKDEHFRECGRRRDRGEKVSREETEEVFKRLNQERAQRLRPILSDEQWEKFKKLEEGRRDWLRHRERKAPPNSPLTPPPPAAPAPAPPGVAAEAPSPIR